MVGIEKNLAHEEKEFSVSSHALSFQPRVRSLDCQKEEITAYLDDGRKLTIPTTWFPRLRNAALEQLKHYKILPDGYHLHWPEIDEDISLRVFAEGLGNGCC